jgi:hypothetical protein
MKCLATPLTGPLVLVLTTSLLAAGPKPAPKAAPVTQGVRGTLVAMTKDKVTNTGTITVKVQGQATTYTVTEKTRFEFFNQVSAWGANFLNEHVGKDVAVFARGGSNPPEAFKVQILLPKPQPPPPSKPSRVVGTVTGLDNGHIIIKLPNRTPPPPVTGTVADLSLDQVKGYGTISVKVNGKTSKYWVNSGTFFQTLGAKQRHWQVSFLSIQLGETVKIFPRYGHPHLAGTVDILLKGSKAPPAIKYKDTFLKFRLKPNTKYELVRDGKHKSISQSAVTVGEQVGILPHAIHSHVADNVQVLAPNSIHGQLVSSSGSGITVKISHGGKAKGSVQSKTVPVTGSTQFRSMQGKTAKPATKSALKPGQHLVIALAAPPPHPAETVEIHLKPPPKPQSFQGTIVSAGGGKLAVKARGGVKHFTLTGSTKLEAHSGKKSRAAKTADLKPGTKVVVVALSEPPHVAQRVQIQVALNKGKQPGKDKSKKDRSKPKPPPPPKPRKKK